MNSLISAYFDAVEVSLIETEVVNSYTIVRREVAVSDGKLRVNTLLNVSQQLEFFIYVHEINGQIAQSKYSFHWQHADGTLIRRWDNAPHHREIVTFPHHVHDGHEKNVLAHESIDFFEVLDIIEAELNLRN